ncbi:Uncharacterised protein [Nocardia otitidiscaviarum]|uniref:Uncharacterized protein n=1 Tax=Nocardia otitidiscaviarum TaxID=1823 RepID=A0A379JMS7_9NOCA|nr:hypothetical protein [Nocardia otitidiscaviarum]SUD49531.1 Uncharacterised protein [Nocardia otitidiscaviarum]
MGSRSTTTIITPTGRASFYLHWGSPEYQVPRIAEWTYEMAMRAEELTVDTWEQWAAEVNGDKGGAAAAERIDYEPGDLEHRYEVEVGPERFEFRYWHRVKPWQDGPWIRVLRCGSVPDLLAEAVRQVERMRNFAARYRKENGLAEDSEVPGLESVADMTAWRSECADRADVYAALFCEGARTSEPDSDAYPERVDGQSDADYAAARKTFCVDAARHVVTLAREYRDKCEFDTAELLWAEARGLIRAAQRIK